VVMSAIAVQLNEPMHLGYESGFRKERQPLSKAAPWAGWPTFHDLTLPQLRLPHPSRFSKGGRQAPQPHPGTRTLSSAFFCSFTSTGPASP
jgi:hypothetical protein